MEGTMETYEHVLSFIEDGTFYVVAYDCDLPEGMRVLLSHPVDKLQENN